MKGKSKRRGKTTRKLSKAAKAVYARRWPEDNEERVLAQLPPEKKAQWVLENDPGGHAKQQLPVPQLKALLRHIRWEYGFEDEDDRCLFGRAVALEDRERVIRAERALSPREKLTLILVLRGYTQQEIGDFLGCSARTIRRAWKKVVLKWGQNALTVIEANRDVRAVWREQIGPRRYARRTGKPYRAAGCCGDTPLNTKHAGRKRCAKTVCRKTRRRVSYCPLECRDERQQKLGLSLLPGREDWAYWVKEYDIPEVIRKENERNGLSAEVGE